MPRGNTVTSTTYADLLKNHLRPAIKSKWRGLLSTGVLLQHDNARPHTARSNVAKIQDLSFDCLPHPPYSPDLAPSNFHVFGPLKRSDGRQVFHVRRRGAAGDARVAALSAKILFFLEVSMHFRSAGTLVWNAIETTWKNDVIVYLMCSINYEIKKFKVLIWLTLVEETRRRGIRRKQLMNELTEYRRYWNLTQEALGRTR